jgi:hypothetical protein
MNGASNQVTTWSGWDEAAAVVAYPRHLRRTVTVAVAVGTVFFAMNQLTVVLAGHATAVVWLKVAMTYLTPFCVSYIGILAATRTPRERSTKTEASPGAVTTAGSISTVSNR